MTGEMAPLPHDDDLPSRDQLRASHEDRDRVVEVLRVAAGDGRLTAEELDERLERALLARTYGELAALTTDLPDPNLPALPLSATAAALAQPKDVSRIECQSGNARRDGRWVVPRRLEVRVTSGNVHLDFSTAVIVHRSVQIDAEVRSGNLTIVTRPGIVVDTDEVVVRSGNVSVRAPRGPEVPVTLMISVSGKVGSGNITARPPRRTLWQWLMRRPPTYAIAAR
jgi:hypothetical protein